MKLIKSNDGEWIQSKGYKKKILLQGDSLNSKGALVQIINIDPHTQVKSHYHKKTTEVFHVIEGKGTFIINGEVFHLSRGDTLTCEPNEVHSTKNDSDRVFKYVVFKTNAEAEDSYWLEE